MLPQPILAPWARLFASLALEVILVFALTALLARLVRSASGQRMIWRLSFVALAALVLSEFSGVGHSLLQHLRASPPASATPRAFVVTTSVSDDIVPTSARAPISFDVPVAPATTSHEKNRSPLAWWLPVLALAGLVWFGARRSFCALRLLRLGRQTPSDSGDLAARVQSLGRRLGIRRDVRVKTVAQLSSPIAFGIFRPTVGVPKDFSVRFTAAQQDAMLAHELAHIATWDAVWMLLADFVAALLWWHPGAWWARRNLRTASETAADEASLLLEDGPATLAECLVTLGDLLTRSPDPGGLGMAGFRFRSELGRRVERLLHLRGPALKPWRGATAWLARLLVPAALLGLALAVTAWLLPPAAGAATFREAFQGSPLGLATTALLTAEKDTTPRLTYKGKQRYGLEKNQEAYADDARTLLLLGKKLYDGGNTNEAEATWRKVLELDPGNKVALDYLKQVGLTYSPAPKPAVQPSDASIPQLTVRTQVHYVTNARQRIYKKLNTIRLESVMFDDVPLTQALEQVRKEAKIRDPEKKGVNLVISTEADPQAAIRPPMFGPGPAEAESDINATTVRINPALNDVTLGQVLDVIVKVANRPIKYTVEDYGVLFSVRGLESLVLHTRWYKIDPNTFLHGLEGILQLPSNWRSPAAQSGAQAQQPGQVSRRDQQGQAGIDSVTVKTPGEIVIATIRAYFQAVGVTLDPPKSIIFSDTRGMLMVRATLADLDVIEQAVQVLNTAPPQVVIEVKFCEVPEDSQKALGFDWLLGSVAVASDPAGAPPERRQNAEGPQSLLNSGQRNVVTNAPPAPLKGILTPPQFRVILRALEERQGVDILTLPKVVTPTGRQAQIKTVEVRTIVTGLDLTTNVPAAPGQPAEHPPITKQFELGPVLDVVPYVAADGRTIQMTVIPTIKEFIGYDVDYAVSKGIWDSLTSPGANPPPISQMYPLPIFRQRQVVSTASVRDGQTLVLTTRAATTGVPESHIANKLPKELAEQLSASIQRMEKPPQKPMVVFITPTIVDAAGNRVHTDEDLPARTNSVPSQSTPALK